MDGMRKTKYLENNEVSRFCDWLRNVDSSGRLIHSYEIESKGSSKKTTPWGCNGLFDAYEKYEWPYYYDDLFEKEEGKIKKKGHTYDDNKAALMYFRKKLSSSISEGNNEKCYKACHMILHWGGVLGSTTRGNKKLLNELKDILVIYLKQVKALFDSDTVSLNKSYSVVVAGVKTKVIMNSGFTKIYALLCNNFIIYDGRVGAALGLLVRSYCEDRGFSEVPKELAFRYGKAKNKNVNRDPSINGYRFRQLHNSYPLHIRENLKANWIIDQAIGDGLGRFVKVSEPMRAVEAALFMIGYRV